MSNLPLKPLVWDAHEVAAIINMTAESPLHSYTIYPDQYEGGYVIYYFERMTNESGREYFNSSDEAQEWAQSTHYPSKMQPYVMPDSITDIANWFKTAKPEPTFNDAMTQYGCHIEEVCEMLDAMSDSIEAHRLTQLADWYKQTEYKDRPKPYTINIELLDALCDQIVTATGVAYMMGFDIDGALKEVIRSNNSKMVKGKFEFDENGKIMKPDSYSKPDLTPFVKQGE